MSFDKETRNILARSVGTCRRRLIEDVTDQLRGVYGLHPDGTVLPVDKLTHLSPDQHTSSCRLRDLLAHYSAAFIGNDSIRATASYERLVLEIAFTILNRLAALRLCEERGLVVECVRKGTSSAGFQMFERISGGALGGRYDAYRIFLECLFDELALDLGVLFDRLTPLSSVFPSERCMEEVLAELNRRELTHLWTEDETIGWVYQYFNPPEERRAMRDASQAPRSSRELAVRNQFFTPRYVVEFLTDNTLGRIWYEMCKGVTVLQGMCRYLVKRPNEVFLQLGEETPADQRVQADLSQEELLKQAVYIEHRPKKDPRDLRDLDPACGSGHFLLYSFDLYEKIYEEAWEDSESPKSLVTGRTLREDFENLDELRKMAPKLIIENNLHGIDIDPRAVQIAALALWLRAQKTWKTLGLTASARPRITKSNIVTAEPMPGEDDMRREFTEGLKPKILGRLVNEVFEKMKLAGEAGSLLKIEEEIRGDVAAAKTSYIEELGKQKEEAEYLPGMAPPREPSLFDFSDLDTESSDFWEQAEDLILDSLKVYAQRSENGSAVRRRLFADDAARGFAFIDLCRKCYDVVLMNPPFGSTTDSTKAWFRIQYPTAAENMSVGTIQQALKRLSKNGYVGLIGDLPWLQQTDYKRFRTELLEKRYLKIFAELGWGILGTDVEVAIAIFSLSENKISYFVNLVNSQDQADELLFVFNDPKRVVVRDIEDFSLIENIPFAYQISDILLRAFKQRLLLKDSLFEGAGGVAASESNRVFRCWWEVDAKTIGRKKTWAFCQNGSPYCPLYYPTYFVIRSDAGTFLTIKSYPNARTPNADKYWKTGLAFGKRTGEMYTYPLPSDQVITWEGQALFPHLYSTRWHCLALTNSSLYSYLANLISGQHKYAGYLNTICLDISKLVNLSSKASAGYECIRKIDELNELSHSFSSPTLIHGFTNRSLIDLVSESEQCAEEQLLEIDTAVYSACGINNMEFGRRPPSGGSFFSAVMEMSSSNTTYVLFVIAYLLGCVFGRWDLRIINDPSLAPKLPDPFDPLPVCPPVMLVGPDGLPAEVNRIVSEEWLHARQNVNSLPLEGSIEKPTITDSEYPLRISWDGILVDDPGFNEYQPHRDDIVRRVREVFDLLWKDKAHEIEQEACDILGVSDLRDYFHRPAGFFQDHLKCYSKSRRRAPIYWPLSTPSGSYTIWIYYHRLNDQTIFLAVNKYIEPKIAEIERIVSHVEVEQKTASGREATRLTDRLKESKVFLGELRDLRDELLRIAALPYKPNLNDGVIINAAPFHKLFRLRSWASDTVECWNKLADGGYDWAHLAYTIWPDRVKTVCKSDRSIAIAHGLEELYSDEVTAVDKKSGRRKKEAAR